jgi:hypothetical protein
MSNGCPMKEHSINHLVDSMFKPSFKAQHMPNFFKRADGASSSSSSEGKCPISAASRQVMVQQMMSLKTDTRANPKQV